MGMSVFTSTLRPRMLDPRNVPACDLVETLGEDVVGNGADVVLSCSYADAVDPESHQVRRQIFVDQTASSADGLSADDAGRPNDPDDLRYGLGELDAMQRDPNRRFLPVNSDRLTLRHLGTTSRSGRC